MKMKYLCHQSTDWMCFKKTSKGIDHLDCGRSMFFCRQILLYNLAVDQLETPIRMFGLRQKRLELVVGETN